MIPSARSTVIEDGPPRFDRGFVLSDHADWPGLLAAIAATEAETIWLTHGYTAVVARWLRERGRVAQPVATRYEGERDDSSGPEGPAPLSALLPTQDGPVSG